MNEYKLAFKGAFSINGNSSIFEKPISNEEGIYLWTIKAQDKHFIEYVGETGSSFRQRTKEHMIQVLGGNYRVLDPDFYQNEEVKVVWNRMWRKGTRDQLNEFIHSYVAIAPKIVEYIDAINIFIAPIKVSSYERKLLEGAIASYVKAQPLEVSKFYPKDNRTYNPKPNQKNTRLEISSTEAILGLPSELFI